jgi:hypothetical protein
VLAGRRVMSRDDLNNRFERWSVEVPDLRLHGTIHKWLADRFEHEQLSLWTPGRPLVMSACRCAVGQ